MAIDSLRAPARPALRDRAYTTGQSWFDWLRADPLPAWFIVAALALITLISGVVRLETFKAHYWIDEGLSVGIASHPFGDIPSLLKMDGSPPLYYLILHVWMAAFGRGEIATHALSFVFAMLTIPVAYWAGASLFDRRTGLVCAVLAGGASYLTAYAQETRMYSLLALLSLLVAASFIEVFVRRRGGYLPVFVLSLVASLYTHNWALFLALMSVAAFLFCVREQASERRALWRDGAIAFGGVAILYAPWVPTVVYQAHHTGAPWALPPVFWSLTQSFYSLVGGRGAAVALLLGGGAGLLALRHPENARAWVRLAIKCLFILGLGTLLIAWLYSKTTPAWAPRYLAVIVGPLLIVFGLGVRRGGTLGMVALALCACFWVLDPQRPTVNSKSNVALVVHNVQNQLPPSTLVLSTQPEQVPVIAYYLPHVTRYATPLGPVIDPHIVDWRDALSRFRRSSVNHTLRPLLRRVAPGQRVALITPAIFAKQPEWMSLIEQASNQWQNELQRDHRFEQVASNSAKWLGSGVPVKITVFARR